MIESDERRENAMSNELDKLIAAVKKQKEVVEKIKLIAAEVPLAPPDDPKTETG